jgi:hypothetical protein
MTAMVDVEPMVVADLTVSALWLSSGTPRVGTQLEYAADVQNLGPDAVTGATFTWVAFGDVTLDGVFGFCTEIENPIFGDVAVQCPVDPISSGQTDGVPVFQITPQSAGDLTIWATATVPTGATDPDPDNNRMTAMVDVEPAVVADLTVATLDLLSGTPNVGVQLEYAAVVANGGPDAVIDATFTWVAFGDVTLDGVSGFCTEVENPTFGDVAVRCPVDLIRSEETFLAPLFQITPQSGGLLTIWATVAAPEGTIDPDPDDNLRTATYQVEP